MKVVKIPLNGPIPVDIKCDCGYNKWIKLEYLMWCPNCEDYIHFEIGDK